MKYNCFYSQRPQTNVPFFFQYQCRFLGRDSVPVVLCANKSDLVSQRTVNHAEAVEWASPLNIPVIETSAKTNQNIQDAFITLVRIVGIPRRFAGGGLLNYRLAVVGSAGVGKSSICVQFNLGCFVDTYVGYRLVICVARLH